MVTVKLFGTLRLDTGIKELVVDARDIETLCSNFSGYVKEKKPHVRVKESDIRGCYVVVNGVQTSKNVKLRNGDVVMLMSPVCGG